MTVGSHASGIYVSYRSGDAPDYARQVYDRLVSYFGQGQVRLSAAAVQPGSDASRAQQDVASSEVLLAVIGPSWLSRTGAKGPRGIDDPADPVRLEIQTALRGGVIVIPVLVRGARPPRPDELPADIRDLARFSGVKLTDNRWSADLGGLLSFVYDTLRDARTANPHAAKQLPSPPPALTPALVPPATAPRQDTFSPLAPTPAGGPTGAGAPVPAPPEPGPRRQRSGKRRALAGGVAAAVIAIFAVLAMVLAGGGTPTASQSPLSTTASPATPGPSPASAPTASPTPASSQRQIEEAYLTSCESVPFLTSGRCRCALEKIKNEKGYTPEKLTQLTQRFGPQDIENVLGCVDTRPTGGSAPS